VPSFSCIAEIACLQGCVVVECNMLGSNLTSEFNSVRVGVMSEMPVDPRQNSWYGTTLHMSFDLVQDESCVVSMYIFCHKFPITSFL
jgi:hypothetical protein